MATVWPQGLVEVEGPAQIGPGHLPDPLAFPPVLDQAKGGIRRVVGMALCQGAADVPTPTIDPGQDGTILANIMTKKLFNIL